MDVYKYRVVVQIKTFTYLWKLQEWNEKYHGLNSKFVNKQKLTLILLY
jgi:hypothetical protein